jgi:hypothetical protein
MSEQQARMAADQAGMELIVDGTLYSVESAGTVVAQSPLPTSQPWFAHTLQVTLSSGKQELIMPTLVGEAELRARTLLEQMGLHVQVVFEYAPDATGKVLSTQPTPDEVVQTGDIVVVCVGSPRSQVSLIEYDLAGKTAVISVINSEAITDEDARAMADDVALRLASLLQAAEATVLTDADIVGLEEVQADVYIELTLGEHEVDVIHLVTDTENEKAIRKSSLVHLAFDQLGKIPLSRVYGYRETMPFTGALVVSFGILVR